MNYIQVKLLFDIIEVDTDVVASMLMAHDFDSFEESPDGILAYIPEELWNKDEFTSWLPTILDGKVAIEFSEPLEDRNWNEVWESNFPAVIIAGKCRVRAPFHEPDLTMPLELIIEPKMSFGTAHHETTSLVIELQLNIDWKGKNVLDMGCGTGILAIVSAKLGASYIRAIDNDKWAYENTLENIERNGVADLINVEIGDASLLNEGNFDVVIANINRNILLQDMHAYAGVMKPGATLILSGFYTEDLPVIINKAIESGLAFKYNLEKNNWVAAVFQI